MTDLLKTAALQLMTPYCYDQYFVNFNFFHGECMKSTLSKTLGLAIVAASITVKVPQILKIIKNKSGKGISVLGISLELICITSFFLYSYLKNFPFSAWGDGLFVGIQTAAILGLVLHYKKQKMQLGLFLAAYVGIVALTIAGVIPISVLWIIQILNLPIVTAGKGAQILANYKNKGTGQLSALTYWLLFGGTMARIFTSVQETGDYAIIVSFVVAAILNGVTVFQLHYYAKPSQKKSKKKEGSKKEVKKDAKSSSSSSKNNSKSSKKENKSDNKKESRSESKKENRNESKKESRNESKKENKKENKKEVKNDNKNDNKKGKPKSKKSD